MNNKIKIDFSFSIQDWLDLINRFFGAFENFFRRIGFPLFAESTEEESTTPICGFFSK